MSCDNQVESTILPTLNTQQEKSSHYSYLKDFRVEPCPLFKQHQCQQHRPYSCFYWHFDNQRRRRPVRKKEFTFNYSADVYCTKYNENTGLCEDKDDCQYLHRVYGDVERKYHLRYYKTALCVHSADSKGNCTKNGQHCAFAHGPDDLRNPIFDIRELHQSSELNIDGIERDRLNFVVEDPIWQDQDYVLANYKTEQCKKPPRLCRQGYACPYYHNGKDKRRPVAGNKYRSTPCPSVKHGDEWGEPEICESGDSCAYCHTRTEQQFHTEIYKSTRCNDMQQHGYCPRGPFCAFAHTEGEMHIERQYASKEPVKKTSSVGSTMSPGSSSSKKMSATTTTSDPGVVVPGSPVVEQCRMTLGHCSVGDTNDGYSNLAMPSKANIDGGGTAAVDFMFSPASVLPATVSQKIDMQGCQAPIGILSYSSVLKQRHHSESSSKCSAEADPKRDAYQFYSKAPGFEREQQSPTKVWSNDIGVRDTGLSKIKANLYFSHEIGCELVPFQQQGLQNGPSVARATPPTPTSLRSLSFSPFGGQTASCWSIGGPACKDFGHQLEDVGLEDLPSIKERSDTSLNQYRKSSSYFDQSAPVAIPGSENLFSGHNGVPSGFVSNFPTSPQSAGNSFFSFSCNDHVSNFSAAASNISQTVTKEIHSRAPEPTSPGLANSILITELNRTKEELQAYRIRSNSLEENLKLIKQNFDTWKRRVEECRQRELLLEQEKIQATQERDAALTQLALLKNEMQRWQIQGVLPVNADYMNQSQLEQIQLKLKNELSKVERQIQQRLFGNGPMCARCGRNVGANVPSGACPICSPPKVKSRNQPVTLVT